MKKLRIKLKNTEAKFWDPTRADFIDGSQAVEVPDAPFWRRRITDGTFVLEQGDATPGKRAIEASLDAEAETTRTGPIRSKGKRSKAKADDAKADDAKVDEPKADDADADAQAKEASSFYSNTDDEG